MVDLNGKRQGSWCLVLGCPHLAFDPCGVRDAFVVQADGQVIPFCREKRTMKFDNIEQGAPLNQIAFGSDGSGYGVSGSGNLTRFGRDQKTPLHVFVSGGKPTLFTKHYNLICIGRWKTAGQEADVLCVADQNNPRISCFDLDQRRHLADLQIVHLHRFVSIAMDRRGQWLVLDATERCVRIFSQEGCSLGAFGGDVLQDPTCMAIDLDGRILVGEHSRVHVFVFPI